MPDLEKTFRPHDGKPDTVDGVFSETEVGLANRNHGLLLETLKLDITPTGTHYLLNHFDVPLLDAQSHSLTFSGAFDAPYELTIAQIRALPEITMPVTMECAGNGRAGVSPRSFSMPWRYEAVGTSEWTGTPLAPLIEKAQPQADVVEFSFTGADYGFDMGEPHFFGRSLTLQQLQDLDVMLVHGMNGAPLLPQHGAPLRLIVPGWYGMASVKWLTEIEALCEPYQGFQQMRTYRFKANKEDAGRPVQAMRVKSLMLPPGVPDWKTRRRYVKAGPVDLMGRAWCGAGRTVVRVEVEVLGEWKDAVLQPNPDKHAWSKWTFPWDAQPGEYVLRCRATDSGGETQPLEPPWDLSGFANNAAHCVYVFVE
ncbi:MAG: molybdopterin-dependent oxidoreductase [Pseudomonadota bacterium]